MCGIAGIISQSPLKDYNCVKTMQESLHHRGPDGGGEYHDTHVALAMRRLSIIDPSGGWQPLFNEDRSVVVIANAEIYNYIEIREDLKRKGHSFKTAVDTETIVHLYEEHGAECVQYLRGMFAFALWDVRKQTLLLARDRLGEKPLYLWESDGKLLFASELKAILRSGMIPFRLDPTAVDLYFHYHYVPEPRTPVQNVRKLPAAHVLLLHAPSWEKKENCYWRFEDIPPIEGDPANLIREELESVSKIVIRSDVPVGVALSGGIDSSAIAALLSKTYPGTLQAFSVGYTSRPYHDERQQAKAFADHLKIPFTDIELSTEEMVSFFPKLVYLRDDPIADPSGHGYYMVMKVASEHHVPVMIQGQGGDELFWGYDWVKRAALESMRKRKLVDSGGSNVLDYLQFSKPVEWSPWAIRQWMTSAAGLIPSWERYRYHKGTPPDQLIFYDLLVDFHVDSNTVYTADFLQSLNCDPFSIFTMPQPWESIDVLITRLIYQTYLMENGIAQADRLSMASSVELRLPLLDYKLVETVIGLRKAHSDIRLEPKAWFKRALNGLLPDWVLTRPKRGFQPPQEWHAALFSAYGSTLNDGYLVQSKILKKESARDLATGVFPSNSVVPLSFRALVLETWCRQLTD